MTLLGDGLRGVPSEIYTKKSRRPVPRNLVSYSLSLRILTIPAAVVNKFRPFQGDLTTTDLGKLALQNGAKYDLIFCFNTMEYLNETERALAGINVRASLAENGVFVTDNRFESDLGERPQQPKKRYIPRQTYLRTFILRDGCRRYDYHWPPHHHLSKRTQVNRLRSLAEIIASVCFRDSFASASASASAKNS